MKGEPSVPLTAEFLEPSIGDKARSSRSQSFLRLSLGFWSGETRARAWLLTAAIAFFLFANLGAALAVNRWNKFFFDALEQKDTKAVVLGLGLVLALALFSAAFSVGLLHARMRLQVRWRQWLTRLISRWLADRHFYQLAIVHTEADNPEGAHRGGRPDRDRALVDFSLGLLNAVLAAISFIGILWVVGGSLTVAGYSIPATWYSPASSTARSRRSACSCWAGRWCAASRKRRPVKHSCATS